MASETCPRLVNGRSNPGWLFSTGGRRGNQPPELTISDHCHDVSPRRKTPDLHELHAANRTGNLQHVGSAADQHVRRTTGFRLYDGARPVRGHDRFAPRPAQETRERQALARETPHATESRLLAWVRERRHQLARGLVALAAHAQAAVNDLFQVITAGQRADIAAANRACDVATQ